MSCELVGTGWYASDVARNYVTQGDDSIRGAAFRPLWWKSLETFIEPQHVFIVDSASPVKPDDARYANTPFQTLELLVNPGHSQNGKTHYSGYMGSVILGLEFALHSDADMFLYVEQDALVFGPDIVGRIKHALRRHDLVFGASASGRDIQQSFFAVSKKGIRRFLAGLHAIGQPDKRIAPEHKFMFAASPLLPAPALALALHVQTNIIRSNSLRLFALLCRLSKNYAVLPFGYGRDRPINFADREFYFQQGSAAEVAQYRQLTGL